MDEATARAALVDAARHMESAGLNHNATGNLSVRVDGRLLVTPSGIPASAMTPEDAVLLDPAGEVVGGHRRPTSEWRLHTEILRRRPDVVAVAHAHSPEATAAAVVHATIPPVHYVAARFTTDGSHPELPCAPYATYGTPELAAAVADTLGTAGMACLMANHGVVALGASLADAVALVGDVEWLCHVHRLALQRGRPVALSGQEIELVAIRFAGYGQPPD